MDYWPRENSVYKKLLLLLLCSVLLGAMGYLGGLTNQQTFVLSVFLLSILGTLFFWQLRLGFLFAGSGLLLLFRSVTMTDFIRFASLDVILFLISMMIIVAVVKDTGVFSHLTKYLLSLRNISGTKLFIILMVLSAVFSALMGEATSIIIMVSIILSLCAALKIRPTALIISSVLATNIGSASTVLGNPIGILIAARANLSFSSFLTHALPISAGTLAIVIFILLVYYRKFVYELSEKMKAAPVDAELTKPTEGLSKKPLALPLLIFSGTILLLALHSKIEVLFGLEENTMLIMGPTISAGIALLYSGKRTAYYVEHEIEWQSLLFFIFLFAQAGVIQASGIAAFFAQRITESAGTDERLLSGVCLLSSGLLSSLLDNTVVVASYVPVVKNLHVLHGHLETLWWALLFGACYGGNITVIGSTANIIAIDFLQKENQPRVSFIEWLKVGLLVGIVSMVLAYVSILLFF